MFAGGSLRIGSWRGAPIRLHWTTAVGALLFSHGEFAPGFWLGFILLVLLHELGHAILVVRRGLQPVAIDVHGFGGMCRYTGGPSRKDVAIIAWGGVLAQALLLAATLGLLQVLPPITTPFWADMAQVFVSTNVFVIGLNLLPIRPLDGAEAWGLLGMLSWPSRRPRASAHEVDREVRRILERVRDDTRRD